MAENKVFRGYERTENRGHRRGGSSRRGGRWGGGMVPENALHGDTYNNVPLVVSV